MVRGEAGAGGNSEPVVSTSPECAAIEGDEEEEGPFAIEKSPGCVSSSADSSIVGMWGGGDPALDGRLNLRGLGGARNLAGTGTGVGGTRSGPDTAA